MAKPVPTINEPFVGLDGRITDVWYKYLLSLGYSESNGGNGGSSDSNSLLKFEFDDHIRNNLSWLRADTFSWQDGEVYVGVYEHLLEDIEGKELQSETIGGITIQYYLADDKHKICPATEEIPIMNLYNNIGIAWYYIIDTDNKFFKLPRNKWGFVGLRDEVGKYIEPKFSHYHAWGFENNNNQGSFIATNDTGITVELPYVNGVKGYRSWNGSGGGGSFTSSSSPYKATTVTSDLISLDNGTIQQASVQCYLYFYVGDADGDDIRKIASANLEKLNSKADTNLNNVSATSGFRRLVEVYNNGTDWYKIYEEFNATTGTYIGKWCEQGGTITSNASSLVVNLLVPYLSTNYNYNVHGRANDNDTGGYGDAITEVTGAAPYDYGLKVDSFRLSTYSRSLKISWDTKGYIS